MFRLPLAAALAVALTSSSSAAILRSDPKNDLYLRIVQSKPANTAVDVLADDEPSRWVGSGGASSSYWILRSTPRMLLWAVDNSPFVQTIDAFDLSPFANAASLELIVGQGSKANGFLTRTYTANGTPITFTYPLSVPEPSTIALAAVAAVALVRCPHCRRKQADKGQREKGNLRFFPRGQN